MYGNEVDKSYGRYKIVFYWLTQIIDVFSKFLDQKQVSDRNVYKKFPHPISEPEQGHGLPGIRHYHMTTLVHWGVPQAIFGPRLEGT